MLEFFLQSLEFFLELRLFADSLHSLGINLAQKLGLVFQLIQILISMELRNPPKTFGDMRSGVPDIIRGDRLISGFSKDIHQ